MGSNWPHAVLGDLIASGDAILQTGPFGTALKANEYSEVGVPLISVREIREGFIEIESLTPRVDSVVTTRLPKFVLKTGDIVFARKGGIERNALITDRENGWFVGSDGIYLRLSDKYNSNYYSYVMRSPQVKSWLLKNCEGTTMPSLNQKILSRIPIYIPPKSIQDKVAEMLGGFDAKISLNNQTNQTLEAMAQAIFKSWFVDFDPVKAKMNGEQPKGMDAATASLFPEKLVESEMGLVPEGWSVNYLNEVAEIKYGKNLPKTKLLDDGYPVFGGNGVIGYYSSYLYEEEQVLVSCRGAASGKVLRSLPNSFVTNNSLVIELSNGFLNINYVEPYLKGCNLEEYTSGSAQPQMTVANMAPVQILVPTEEVLNIFNDLVKPLKSKIRANERENHSLAALRDTLLPKLLSGEIELADTEPFDDSASTKKLETKSS